MNYRFADGGDKIAAFERGMSDEDAHAVFETAGTTAVIVDEAFLVAYYLSPDSLIVRVTSRLYAGGDVDSVAEFLQAEAETFGVEFIA